MVASWLLLIVVIVDAARPNIIFILTDDQVNTFFAILL